MKSKKLLLILSSMALLSACGQPSSSSDSSSSGEASFDPASISESIVIHYHRDDNDYKTWNLWLWAKNGGGNAYSFEYTDSYGGICVEKLSTFFPSMDMDKAELGFIVRTNDWAKDVDEDRYLDFSALEHDGKGNYEIWLYTGIADYFTEEPKNVSYLSKCAFSDAKTLSLQAGAGKLYGYELFEDDVSKMSGTLDGVTNADIRLDFTPDVAKSYKVKATFAESFVKEQKVNIVGLYEDESFDEAFYYGGNDLGVTYSSAKSTFKVWSPVSSKIVLKIYDTGTPASLNSADHPGSDTPIKTVDMVKGEKGVWSAEVAEDLANKYYTYEVTNGQYTSKEIVDPYARAVGINGLRGMIVDLETTNPEGWEDVAPKPYDRKELVVYETHIADVSSSSTWGGTAENAKKYPGVIEKGTTYTKDGVTVKTGFDHIEELGVNAVQILPMFDQANDETNPSFNWGYNPLNYNAPEGVYSADPYNGARRIIEVKEMVQAFNESGINVIMDVVYNHVNSVSGLNFDVLMPYYYFRYDANLALTNGSGCGNETASDHSMFRKFMIDSAVYWAKEYKLGGFRFDLMGLHDLKTMQELNAEVMRVNPHAVVYGEPWTGGASPLPAGEAAVQANQKKYVGYGAFNDKIRDGLISGGMKAHTTKGWATMTSGSAGSYINDVEIGIKGGINLANIDPDKAVTYASCHDNFTLYDRAKAAYSDNIDDEKVEKMAELAQSVVMTSQGTAFMLAGEEFLRTKGGDDNSYQSSYKVNELDYSLKIKHAKLFNDYQKLVAFKKNTPGLHLDAEGAETIEITEAEDRSWITYEIAGESGTTYKVVHANGIYNAETSGKVNLAGYSLEFNSLGGEVIPSAATELAPFQSLILSKTAN